MHMHLYRRLVFSLGLVLFCLVAFSACSRMNCTVLEPVLGGEVHLVELGHRIATDLINETFPPLLPHNAKQPILVSTPVNNDALAETSSFGRSLQNSIVAGFVERGYVVREIKMHKGAVNVRPDEGEFMLTRELSKIITEQQAQAVVVATYSLTGRTMYLSARLVDANNQAIRAVYEERICLDEGTLRMLGLQFAEKRPDPNDQAAEQITPPSPSILDDLLY